ncbi:hypothetical protein QYE76_005176 [Lolium multiflorum]|uniref:Retrotransposon gag domain-containing protein n=1 Tax=Lolium multiflorum TaxID=4521 RepID=A0AAD8RS41_LOLMU|nr:hypothetical protein QYE76_005176 [Lolium multiflorum]
MPLASRPCAHGRALATCRATTSSTPWTLPRHVEHRSDTTTPPDMATTRPWTAAAVDGEEDPATAAAVVETTRPNQASPDQAVAALLHHLSTHLIVAGAADLKIDAAGGRRRRLELFQEEPPVPGASPSSTTSPSTLPTLAGATIMAPPSINFNQFLEKEKLKGNGSNFTDWFRHVRIFLTGGSLQYVLDAPLGPPPPPAVSGDIKNVYETRATRYSEVQCAILCSLEAELQKRFEHHDPCEMMRELKLIFETHAAVESYEASKQFFSCMMEEGSSVSEHMFAMSGHAKKLSDMGMMIPNQLGIHRVLQSLPPSYKNFVMNYNMQNMNKYLPELFSMMKSAEVEIKKENQVLMVNKTTGFKKQGKPNKGNFKKGGKKVAAHPEKPKAGPKPETVCYYCQGKGHWKRLIYMLLMSILLVLVVVPGYLILVRLLTFVTRNRNCGIDEAWQGTR